MTKIVFQHRRGSGNVGDENCTPGRWFDFGSPLFQNFGEDVPPCDLAVFGGGQVMQQCLDAGLYHSPEAKARVIWGVGMTQKAATSTAFTALRGLFNLVSSRDPNVPGVDHVPCVSAMSPQFDAPPAPVREVVLFAHAQKSGVVERPEHIPCLTNHNCTMEEAIAFLASAETVVTNSYHGTYWAMCLGRKVLCLPFSDKFSGFLTPPEMADPENWSGELARAAARHDILPHARAANRAFHDQVMNLL